MLAPLLFTLYINDICGSLEHCNTHFYADNTLLYATTPSVEQDLSNPQCVFDCVHKSLQSLQMTFLSLLTFEI